VLGALGDAPGTGNGIGTVVGRGGSGGISQVRKCVNSRSRSPDEAVSQPIAEFAAKLAAVELLIRRAVRAKPSSARRETVAKSSSRYLIATWRLA
jgi:hypothetical protein